MRFIVPNGMMQCPFHDDETPSMKVERNFICFGCQEKGDVIRFAEKRFNLQPSDAVRKLVEDFGLNVTAPKTDPAKPPPEKHAHPVNGVRIVKMFQGVLAYPRCILNMANKNSCTWPWTNPDSSGFLSNDIFNWLW